MMIDIKCYHDLELPNEVFPTELPAVPAVGDLIGSKTQYPDGIFVELEVKRVRWLHDGFDWLPCVELWVPSNFDSHAAFYEHYESILGGERDENS